MRQVGQLTRHLLTLGRDAVGALRPSQAGDARQASQALAPLEGVPLDQVLPLLQARVRSAPLPEQARFDSELERVRGADEHTLAYALQIARSQLRAMRRFAPIEGARILELGPGYSLVPGLLLYLHGAARYVGADLYPIAYDSSDFYRRMRDLIAAEPIFSIPGVADAQRTALSRFDAAVDLSGSRAVFNDRVTMTCPVNAAKVPFEDGSFDAVLSNAAFEHFERPEDAIQESFRLLSPGGVGLHQIDLRDHRDFSRPLEFLRFSAQEWLDLNRSYMFSFTNRWRRGDYVRAFTRAGFEVVEVAVNGRAPLAQETRAYLHPDFAGLPDDELESVSIHITVRRPAGGEGADRSP